MATRRRIKSDRIGSKVPVVVTGMAFGGEAIARLDGVVVFVPYAIPGETVVVDLFQERKGLLRGEVCNVLEASPHRVVAPCPYFGYCGGCQWQHVDYDYQLELKTSIVREQLSRIGSFAAPPVREALRSPREWHYRNHVRFSTGRHGHLGFSRRHSRRFLAVDRCLISHEAINEILRDVQGQGAGLHQVVVRIGERTGDVLIYPPLQTKAQVAHEELAEELLGQRYVIHRSAFFQVNTLQAERMAALVLDRLSLTGSEVVVDAYCGVGTFAVLLARRVRKVIGIEEAPGAIRNARRNADGVPNVEFIAAKTEHALPAFDEPVDVVVLDPARAGCDKAVIDALAGLGPRVIAYVSCDPATLARDLRMLVDRGYSLDVVQPMDMFPQTYHIENVAVLRRLK